MRVQELLAEPFPLYLEFRKSFPIILGISVFVVLFLILFEPFDLSLQPSEGRNLRLTGYGLVVFLVLCANVYLLPRALRTRFQEETWTFRKNLVFILMNVLATVLATGLYRFTDPACILSLPTVVLIHLQGFLVSIIPLIFLLLLSYVVLLQSRMKNARDVSSELESRKPEESSDRITLSSERESESVELDSSSLLFIQASDNYCQITWLEGSQLRKKLLRTTLSRLETQIPQSALSRCHRSYIVNLYRVNAVSGNAAGYKLSLDGFEGSVPVSRQAAKLVLSRLRELHTRIS